MKLWPLNRRLVADTSPAPSPEQEALLQRNAEARIKLAMTSLAAEEVLTSLTELHRRHLALLGRG